MRDVVGWLYSWHWSDDTRKWTASKDSGGHIWPHSLWGSRVNGCLRLETLTSPPEISEGWDHFTKSSGFPLKYLCVLIHLYLKCFHLAQLVSIHKFNTTSTGLRQSQIDIWSGGFHANPAWQCYCRSWIHRASRIKYREFWIDVLERRTDARRRAGRHARTHTRRRTPIGNRLRIWLTHDISMDLWMSATWASE